MTPSHRTADPVMVGPGHLVELASHRVIDVVEGMHQAITRPGFPAGPHAAGVRRAHQTGASAIYEMVRFGGSAVAAAVDLRSKVDGAGAAAATAAVSALWGDDPARPPSTDTTIRDTTGAALTPTTEGLAAGFPDASPRLIVVLHGLGQTERSWNHAVTSLDDDCSLLRIRFNTGLPVASSAADLAAILEDVVAHWPVEVDEVVLIGYSMGGLVARAAVNQADVDDRTWAARTRQVITVATPLLGSPIEKGAEMLARGLAIAPQTRPLAGLVSGRSQGIKDLRHGSAVDDELPEHVDHHCIAAVVTDDHRHPVGRVVGDLVVRTMSATGRGRDRSIEQSSRHVLGGRHHANVLKAPELPALLRSLAIDERDPHERAL